MSDGSAPATAAHITALRNQDKLNRRAAKRIRIVNGKVEKYAATQPRNVEAVVAEAVRAVVVVWVPVAAALT